MEFRRPVKLYDKIGNSVDACVAANGQDFCSFFGPAENGGVRCVVGGKITPDTQAFETAAALVFCDAATPGCGPQQPQTRYCQGTAEPCLPQGSACPGACHSTNYFMGCPHGAVVS